MGSYIVVTRRGTLAQYRWEASAPMALEAADALVAEHRALGWRSWRRAESEFVLVGLPEGWVYGQTDAACIRQRLAEIEQERHSAQGAYETKGWGPSDLRAQLERLETEEVALRRRLGELGAESALDREEAALRHRLEELRMERGAGA